ncbi:hypothetical protein G6F37_003973 [Rhizopus arrhizus]|nr:hypothetical protein G6F38_004651 [Rhizopus arrhizus]KAG1160464.1 hypothetical protein G6F37_003973 [Rhizopus arrhizus]
MPKAKALRKALDQTTEFTKSSPEKNQKEQEIVKGNLEEEVKKRDKKDDKKKQLEEKATSSASKQIEELGKTEANDDEGTEGEEEEEEEEGEGEEEDKEDDNKTSEKETEETVPSLAEKIVKDNTNEQTTGSLKEMSVNKNNNDRGNSTDIELGPSKYTAFIRQVPIDKEIDNNNKQENNRKISSLEELQKQSMVASKAQLSQEISDIFRHVDNGKQSFLDHIRVSADTWMQMWQKKRSKTDRNLQWNSIYERMHFCNPLPNIDEMMLINANNPEALGWKLAHAFIQCHYLQGYIVLFAQIVDAYHKKSVEQHYLAGIVDATLHTITDNLSYMNAIEDFLACMYYTTKKVQETKVDTMENLMDPEARDIFAILKSLFNIPQSAIMTGVKTSQNNQKRTNSFNQIFMGLTELINNSDLSLDSIQKAWSTIKMNKAPAVAFGEHIQTIRAQLFNIVNYLINNEDFAWDPQKVTSNIISLLEPFHGGFAPLQVALIKERSFQSCKCDKYGPLLIERMEITGIGGYNFTFNDVQIDLHDAIPCQVKSQMSAVVEGIPGLINKNDIVNYRFYQASATCNIPQYYYEKLYGLPPWKDKGAALLKIKNINFYLQVQSVAQGNKEPEFQVLLCKCDIKQLDIEIEKSQHPKLMNAITINAIKPYAKARLEKELSAIAETFFKEVFVAKLF